jgi:hypothetical protein
MKLAQVFISKSERRMEHCEFVDKGWRFARRFCPCGHKTRPQDPQRAVQASGGTFPNGSTFPP